MKFRRRKRTSAGLDMSPLIDCVLQLLVFFMLSSTFASPKVEIDLPESRNPDKGVTRNDATIITVDAEGHVYVNTELVDIDQLADKLEAVLRKKENKTVAFRGDNGTPLKTVVAVIDAAKRARAKPFAIAVDKATAPWAPNARKDSPEKTEDRGR